MKKDPDFSTVSKSSTECKVMEPKSENRKEEAQSYNYSTFLDE